MYREYYVLMKEESGERKFISRDDEKVLTDNIKEALYFFSENHISVWKKCNPTIKNTMPVKIIDDGKHIEVIEI